MTLLHTPPMSAGAPGPDRRTLDELERGVPFTARHIGPDAQALGQMLTTLGYSSAEELLAAAVPASIIDPPVPPGGAATEASVRARLEEFAAANTPMVSMIGMGYYDTITPAVIRRGILEDPGWYTAYTPYQAEISQGRLEALLVFQTMVAELTSLPVVGASLLDEATAAAEAMSMAYRVARGHSDAFVVDADTHPQTLAVLATRAEAAGVRLVVADLGAGLPSEDFFGVLLSYPTSTGRLRDDADLVAAAHDRGAVVVAATDLLALTLLRPPGEFGVDIAVGSTQRFGVPMGYGGPHAAFLAAHAGLERQMPGRMVGMSVDSYGEPAARLALQTREQHIRREKATSNICTSQVLLAVVAAMYAVFHGPQGLTGIARRVHRLTAVLAAGLERAGVPLVHGAAFDTLAVLLPGRADEALAAAAAAGVNLRRIDEDTLGVSLDERSTRTHVATVWRALGVEGLDPDDLDASAADLLPAPLLRGSAFCTQEVFQAHRSETEMLRYLRALSDKDYALDRGMIPLGSCTMKLNATTELEPITWPAFADLHPFAPPSQAAGTRALVAELCDGLARVTGYDAVSLQPNAGSQGELAGLLAIRGYHRAAGQPHRDVCLVPTSAHGTNAASAKLAGFEVVAVAVSDDGSLDLADLRARIDAYADRLAAIMVTYPSTYGVYEESIAQVCDWVHEAGGQVYVDGANLNALVGVARPGHFGADVSHLNLHKTFCIPHGGGGPGVGPVACRAHLAEFLPSHPFDPDRRSGPVGPVSAAPLGSALILPIAWAYLALMGPAGLRAATGAAVTAANYLATRLATAYPIAFTGAHGLVAHECVLDLRALTAASGVTVEDVAKRLIDYGFHAPTMSFPLAGTLMVEPTESEDLAELDRFVDAMLAIRAEIDAVAAGRWPREDNPLVNAPHPAHALVGEWAHPYSREEAVYPLPAVRARKYWPPVGRVDNARGDRTLICTC